MLFLVMTFINNCSVEISKIRWRYQILFVTIFIYELIQFFYIIFMLLTKEEHETESVGATVKE